MAAVFTSIVSRFFSAASMSVASFSAATVAALSFAALVAADVASRSSFSRCLQFGPRFSLFSPHSVLR